MARSDKRGNREKKKPKGPKPARPAGAPNPFGKANPLLQQPLKPKPGMGASS